MESRKQHCNNQPFQTVPLSLTNVSLIFRQQSVIVSRTSVAFQRYISVENSWHDTLSWHIVRYSVAAPNETVALLCSYFRPWYRILRCCGARLSFRMQLFLPLTFRWVTRLSLRTTLFPTFTAMPERLVSARIRVAEVSSTKTHSRQALTEAISWQPKCLDSNGPADRRPPGHANQVGPNSPS
jgi:hypothetical protein